MNKKNILSATIITAVTGFLIYLLLKYLVKNPTIAGVELKSVSGAGDAFNGLTAPFISFLSAILIYITFKEQVKANKLLSNQTQFDTFFRLFNEIETGWESLRINLKPPFGQGGNLLTYTGTDALGSFTGRIKHLTEDEKFDFLQALCKVLEDFILLYDYSKESPTRERRYFLKRLHAFCESKVVTQFIDEVIEHLPETDYRQDFKNTLKRSNKTISRLYQVNYKLAKESDSEMNINEIFANGFRMRDELRRKRREKSKK